MLKLDQLRCFLFDLDGTVYLGETLLPGAADFLSTLRRAGLPYYFITNNSSRARNDWVAKLLRLGIPAEPSQVFTSSEATALYLQARKPGAALFVVGTPPLEAEFAAHGFTLTAEAPDFAVLGFDTTLTYQKLWQLCDFVRSGLPYIATHPDLNCPTPSGYMPDIGAMIAFVETATGRRPDVIIGKPHPPIVQAVVLKTGCEPGQIAMVGDRLYTDIALGQAGLRTVLVLSGETKPSDLPGSPFQPDLIVQDLAELDRIFQAQCKPVSN